MTDALPPAVALDAAPASPGAVEEAWRRVQLARHAQRPRTLDLVSRIFTDFTELHGDRSFRDDPAIVGGPALLDGRAVMVIGHQKGNDTESNIARNFGSPHPEGFRKGQRLLRLADKLGMPVITMLDTAGAFPGPAAEERGQAEAIASSIKLMTGLQVPIVVVIVGEGGSGGALAIGVGDAVLALENAVYSVISPEGCAAILWRAPDRAPEAAAAMRMTAADQLELGVVDAVIEEPGEGAHTDHDAHGAGRQGRAHRRPGPDRQAASGRAARDPVCSPARAGTGPGGDRRARADRSAAVVPAQAGQVAAASRRAAAAALERGLAQR